jgi:hypothetical protein
MSQQAASTSKRKRGGQPGNVNAIKHGRYARRVPINPSPTSIASSLDEEINMLRTETRRLFELARQAGDIDQTIKVLGALGLASIRTSRLLRAQKELGNGDKVLAIINTALEAAVNDEERMRGR